MQDVILGVNRMQDGILGVNRLQDVTLGVNRMHGGNHVACVIMGARWHTCVNRRGT